MDISKIHFVILALAFLSTAAEALDPVDPPFSPMDVEDVQVEVDLNPGDGQNTSLLVDWRMKASFSVDQPGIDPLQDEMLIQFYDNGPSPNYPSPPLIRTISVPPGCWISGYIFTCEGPGPGGQNGPGCWEYVISCPLKLTIHDVNGNELASEDLIGASGILRVNGHGKNNKDLAPPTAYKLRLNLYSGGLLLNTMNAPFVRVTIGNHSGSKAFGKMNAETNR